MNQEDFEGIVAGLNDAIAFARGDMAAGRIVSGPDVVAIRKKTGLSQARFAATFGLDKRAVQQWEQARRSPDRAAVTLYRMIERDPEAVRQLIAA